MKITMLGIVFVGLLSVLSSDSAYAGKKNAKTDAAMQKILPSYLEIQEKLASDSVEGLKEAAEVILVESKNLDKKIATATKKIVASKNIKEIRKNFKALSALVAHWVNESKPEGYEVVHCSMAEADWVQKKGEIRNPYYGSSMLSCGEKNT